MVDTVEKFLKRPENVDFINHIFDMPIEDAKSYILNLGDDKLPMALAFILTKTFPDKNKLVWEYDRYGGYYYLTWYIGRTNEDISLMGITAVPQELREMGLSVPENTLELRELLADRFYFEVKKHYMMSGIDISNMYGLVDATKVIWK